MRRSHVLGLDDASGAWYLFWSGIGADLGYLAIVGTLAAHIRRHNCHVRPCWRIGRFPVAGTPWTMCSRHHPEDAPRARDLAAQREDAP